MFGQPFGRFKANFSLKAACYSWHRSMKRVLAQAFQASLPCAP